MTTTAVDTSRAAAEQLVGQLPTASPLTVADFDPAQGPDAGAQAVTAHFVGATSADLILVADAAVAAAIESAGEAMSYADVLRPALDAAASTMGAGVLDNADASPVGEALTDPAVEAFALVDAEGVPQAWFGVRTRANTAAAAPAAAPAFKPLDADAERARMRMLHDVELNLTAEIGHTKLPMRQVLELVPGTVLELDRAAGSPADVVVNGRLVARGEVVVIDEDYGIRITEIVSTEAAQ